MYDLFTHRQSKLTSKVEENMNKGIWEPDLPKNYSYFPSDWIGEFDNCAGVA